MTREELAARIDLTLLRPDATEAEFERFLKRGRAWPFAAVCVPPCYVGLACRLLAGTSSGVATVVGFPFGYEGTAVKLAAAREAVDAGARELDMVMNVSAFKSGDMESVGGEISAIVRAAPHATVKVIIECCFLTDEEKALAVQIIAGAGAHFVKTGTGFGPSGATAHDVRLLRKAAKGAVKVKAAGGIRTLAQALEMIEAGADRIGASAGVEMVESLS